MALRIRLANLLFLFFICLPYGVAFVFPIHYYNDYLERGFLPDWSAQSALTLFVVLMIIAPVLNGLVYLFWKWFAKPHTSYSSPHIFLSLGGVIGLLIHAVMRYYEEVLSDYPTFDFFDFIPVLAALYLIIPHVAIYYILRNWNKELAKGYIIVTLVLVLLEIIVVPLLLLGI